MRLYVNSNGQWTGTQAEAKKIDNMLTLMMKRSFVG